MKDQDNTGDFKVNNTYLVNHDNLADIDAPNPYGPYLTDEEHQFTQSIGRDSTSVGEIYATVKNDKGEFLNNNVDLITQLDTFNKKISTPEELKKIDLNGSTQLIQNVCGEYNKAEAKYQGVFAKYAIKIGKGLNLLRKAVKEQGGEWDDFATEKFDGFISKRTRFDYMRLARLKKAEKYALLGKDRLLHLMSVTSGMKDIEKHDPIGSFFKKFNIPFTPETENLLDNFKGQIDTALEKLKAEKVQLDLDPELLEALVDNGLSLRNSDLEELKQIKDSNGDPNIHLKKHIENGGQKERLSNAEKKPESFNKLRTRMRETLKSIKDANSVPGDIVSGEVDELIKDLLELKNLLEY